ncbi:CRISPR-associated protein Cas4 [Sphingobacterium sp. MYb382]|uniref:CRISPR-associated protein Cas4 n=1 Tax=Sphingobacterium sp. MYb382 TaxID=2745278 RepID=UPI0030A485A6
MLVNATHIAYLHTCNRKLWLFSHGIQMEHTSDIVSEGKLIGETSYSDRSEKYTELQLGNVKIDFYDARNKVVHEVKKSDKVEGAHIAQVKYYLYRLRQAGVNGAIGIIEYPKLRQREEVLLAEKDIHAICGWEADIQRICESDICPAVIHAQICKSCSYQDFCYVGEED